MDIEPLLNNLGDDTVGLHGQAGVVKNLRLRLKRNAQPLVRHPRVHCQVEPRRQKNISLSGSIQKIQIWDSRAAVPGSGWELKTGGYFQYRTDVDILNDAIGKWQYHRIPLDDDGLWHLTKIGEVSLRGRYIEIHTDTWGYGSTLLVDGSPLIQNNVIGLLV